MIGSEWVRDPEALGELQGESRTNVTTNCQHEDDKPNSPTQLSVKSKKKSCGKETGMCETVWKVRGTWVLLITSSSSICFLALFPRRNHLDEVYSSIDIFNTYFQCNYTYHNSACEIHIKCIEYNELFVYALRESFIIHITYAFFYIIRIIFWANLQFLHFFLSFLSLTQFNSQNCDWTYLCWTMLQCFKKMSVCFMIIVYKHWVILVTFGNNTSKYF